MIQKFIPTNRNQQYLFPPSIQDWLPEEHLARFVVDIVSQLDLRPLAETYAGKGFKEYHPEILLSLLFYGYATGIFSSRKIEKATYDSVAFRFISTNTHPDHDTIHTSARTHDDITVQACFENGGIAGTWYMSYQINHLVYQDTMTVWLWMVVFKQSTVHQIIAYFS